MAGETLRAFTVRVPVDTYLAAKTFAVVTRRTLGELVHLALLAYMHEHEVDDDVTTLLERTRAKFRETADESPER